MAWHFFKTLFCPYIGGNKEPVFILAHLHISPSISLEGKFCNILMGDVICPCCLGELEILIHFCGITHFIQVLLLQF